MNEGQETFTRLDLGKHNIVRLQIVRDILDVERGDVREVFKDLLDDGRFQDCISYRRGKVLYQITVELEVSADAHSPYFALRYEASAEQTARPTSTRLSRTKERSFLQRCSDDSTEHIMRCDVDFFFPNEKDRQERSWFPLPLKMPAVDDGDSGPISEIRGIRGVKLVSSPTEDDDLIGYSFILDRPFNSNVALHVAFVVSSSIIGSLPNDVLTQARAVATALGIA